MKTAKLSRGVCWLGMAAAAWLIPTYVGAQTITVTSYPTAPVAGGSAVRISWSIQGLTGRLTHNHVHWGLSPETVDQYSTPHSLQGANATAVFVAPSTGGRVYFRVHAIVGGRNIYSNIYSFEATPPAFDTRPQVRTPTISPPGGPLLFDTIIVSLSCETPGARIYYTLDGSDPTELSTLYQNPFQLDLTEGKVTVKARAYKTGMRESRVAVAVFSLLERDRYESDDQGDDKAREFRTQIHPTDSSIKFPSVQSGEGNRVQLHSIHPGGDVDWVKFKFEPSLSDLVVVITSPPGFDQLSAPSIEEFWDRLWVRDPVTRQWVKKPSQIPVRSEEIYESNSHGRIRVYYKKRLKPTGERSDSEKSDQYDFKLAAGSGTIRAYLLSLGVINPKTNNDFHDEFSSPNAEQNSPYVQIRGLSTDPANADPIHIRALPKGDVDWAWVNITSPSTLRFTYITVPGSQGTMTIEIYGPNNHSHPNMQRYSRSVSLRGQSFTEHTDQTNLQKPGIYYLRLTCTDQIPAYVLKVTVQPR